jgi:hypothetical protein
VLKTPTFGPSVTLLQHLRAFTGAKSFLKMFLIELKALFYWSFNGKS